MGAHSCLALFGVSRAGLAVLAVLVFFAGIVDSLAGGGGLITLPAYMAVGVDPRLVLGTNKLSSTFGTTTATVNYLRAGPKLDLAVIAAVAAALVGSALGAHMTLFVDPRWIRYLLLAALPVLSLLLLSHRDFGRVDRSGELSLAERAARSATLSMPIGAYDGFFGPGTGTFFALAFSRFCGYDLVGSTTRAKLLNMTTNVAALASFLLVGRVNVPLGLSMAAASAAGNFTGSHLGIRKGARVIRPALLLVCAGLFVKLLLDAIR